MKEEYEEWHRVCLSKFVKQKVEMEAYHKIYLEKIEILDEILENYEQAREKEHFHYSLRQNLPIDLVHQVLSRRNNKSQDSEASAIFESYRTLCQLRYPHSSLLPLQEKCIYYTGISLAGRLGPYKLEFHAYDPLLVTFHDVLSDELIDSIIATGIHGKF